MSDSSQPEQSFEVHVYKMKPWNLLISLFTLLVFGPLMSLPLVYIIGVVRSWRIEYMMLYIVFLCVFAPLFVLLAIVGLQMLLAVISSFTSNIKVTPEGIENKIWPYRDIRVLWQDLEQVNKFLFFDVVTMKNFEVLGLSLSHTGIMKKLSYLPPSIALSSYNGWPNGQLESDLRRYAPHLFDRQAASETVSAPMEMKTGSDTSQEHRLLAALSHASVLFTGIGAVVPLVIYYSQKRTSDYLAFQSLQAFFYQLLGLLFSFVFPVCLATGTFIPIMIAALTGDESRFGPFMAVIILISVVLTVLIGIIGFFYLIYGTIGAFQAYQGKDFRYPIIGKRVEKRDVTSI